MLIRTPKRRREITTLEEAKAYLKSAKPSRSQEHLWKEVMNGGIDMQLGRFRETLGIDQFDAVTLDASNNHLLAGYGSIRDDWRQIAGVVAAQDFKQRNATRVTELADLPVVPEKSEYVEGLISDERIPYAVRKRGNIIRISLEAMAGDAIGALRNETARYGRAAKRTLNELVLGASFDDNPLYAVDSVALFNAAHNNLLAAASPLNFANLQRAIAALNNQTEGGVKLQLTAWTLLVNPVLLADAANLVASTNIVGTGDAAGIRGNMNPFVAALPGGVYASQWLDSEANDLDWYVVANPAELPVVEVAFFEGREEPDIIKAPPNSGDEFTYDAMAWKIRFGIGAAPVEFRAAVKGDAA
jgi:hypothetical protein